jgi:acyl-CoA thioesterase FadM
MSLRPTNRCNRSRRKTALRLSDSVGHKTKELRVSGLLRNIIAFFVGLFTYGSRAAEDMTVLRFWVTPFDSGLRILKSDKYLQLAETAQVDYLLKVGKLFSILRSGVGFVNVAQLVKFSRPISVFSSVRVETRLIYADEKCAYFSHAMHANGVQAAEVLVKMKFKKGRITVPPSSLLSVSFTAVPTKILSWEPALEAL